MRVAIIGSGGREHALAEKLLDGNKNLSLFILPGNPGTKNLGKNVSINSDDHDSILKFCKEQKIDLVIVGPEKPLIEGLANKLIESNIKVFGPSNKAAMIEGGKSFAKRLMKENNIPTAAFEIYDKENYELALNYLHQINYPTVLKANGIAAGKGVIIAETFDDAKEALKEFFINSSFGSAGDKVVIEEYMTGQEASVFAITDGNDFLLLPPAQDHKRIFDGDKGKNTGGMGAYAPTPFVSEYELEIISKKIIAPTLKALKNLSSPFVGCLYCGLMMTTGGPKVVEFNCRFGDPETQVVLPLIEGNFIELLYSAASGKLNKNCVKIKTGSSVCVVLASKGYPEKYEKGIEIHGLDSKFNDVKIHHAGTIETDGKINTNGGRVLNITSYVEEDDLKKAKQIAYDAINKINFEGMQYRTDISDKAFQKI